MTDSAQRNYPIVVMAFNRPDYLKQVLDSLLQQQGIDLAARKIALFQDGGFNEFSKAQRADPADMEANIAVFRECFPKARVEHSPINLGVALNFERAERWVFEELAADAAIFLEDDMVLSPHYIRTLDRMLDMAMEDQRIGYVAAYGDWTRPLEKQRANPGRLIPLWQNWAFGLTRHQWHRNQTFMAEYLPMVRGADYRDRPHTKIYDLYTRYGMDRAQSSQDRAKLIACVLTGGVRINTTACLAHYIGKVGLHSDEMTYVESGFERTQIYPDGDFKIETITDDIYQTLMKLEVEHVLAGPPKSAQIAPLSFAKGGNGEQALRKGFYPAEGWGVWSGSVASEVCVQLPAMRDPPLKGLCITATHYAIAPGNEVDVAVRVNGRMLGSIRLGRRLRRILLPLPEGLTGADGILNIEFTSSSLSRPKDSGTSGDGRLLGIGLIKFEFE